MDADGYSVSELLGACYNLASHGQHAQAVERIRAAAASNTSLATGLRARMEQYAPVVADLTRNCHIERVIHGLLAQALQ